MYASNSVPCSNIQGSKCSQKIPVETYENRAVLNELSRRTEKQSVSACSCNTSECKSDAYDCTTDNCTDITTDNNHCCCNTSTVNKCFAGIRDKFGLDDAIILLLIILLLTDGNNCNDIMLPVLLGVLLLT